MVENLGLIITLLAAAIAALLPGIGSAKAVGFSGESAAGVLTEDPNKFGRLLILVALPGTQGIYGLLSFFLILNQAGLLAGNTNIPVGTGIAFLIAALPVTLVGYISAIYQGRVAQSGIALVAKRPEEQSKGIVLAAMVETYAILALLATVLAIINIRL